MNIEGPFSREPYNNNFAPVSTSTSSPVFILSHYVWATQAVIVFSGIPPNFDAMHEFHFHLKERYGGFRHDQMQHI